MAADVAGSRVERIRTARWAATLSGAISEAPASTALLASMVGMSGALAFPRAAGPVLRGLSVYHGDDLAHARWWRLVLSALAAQSAVQLIWSVLIVVTVFLALERTVGAVGVIVISLGGHVAATLAVDGIAYAAHWRSWLSRPDFGTSCLLLAAMAAALLATRSRTLAVVLLAVLVGDGFVNSSMVVLEHVVALVAGVAGYLTFAHLGAADTGSPVVSNCKARGAAGC